MNGRNHLIQDVPSEREDSQTSLASPYEMLTYPADYTLQVLVDKYNNGDIEEPAFQRAFVWTQRQSSKLIESFLLNLPVPPIFMFTRRADDSLLMVDGQQRLMSIVFFFEGYFGEESRGRRPVFRLVGLHEESPYLNKTYEELESTDRSAFNQLNNSVLRSFIMKQLHPENDAGMFEVFERLNTGGVKLSGQEIRNCIYHGTFSKLLVELNKAEAWRDILGKKQEDKRKRDAELVLRFLALFYGSQYKKPMKGFLNSFMRSRRDAAPEELEKFRALFTQTAEAVKRHLGAKPFHLRARVGMNPGAFDSVFVAFGHNLNRIPGDIGERFSLLKNDKVYQERITDATTDNTVIPDRIAIAERMLFD